MNYKLDAATVRRLGTWVSTAPPVITVDIREIIEGLRDSLADLEVAKNRIDELEQEIESRKKGMIRLSEQLGERSRDTVLLSLAEKIIAIGKSVDYDLLPNGEFLNEKFMDTIDQYEQEKQKTGE